jgi:AcrR family transcriptional regulator
MAGSETDRSGPRRYPKGERRREEIIAAAAEVYADAGYHGASLREIAKRIGMTHAGLLYHFPNREALLAAVLERRDEQDAERVELRGPVTFGAVGHLLELAGYNERHPALVELYVRLAAEAIAVEHPAHDYFTQHYAMARTWVYSSFTALSEAGQLRAGVDPETAALTFIALMDGLQVQWLTSPDEVDLVGPLRFLLEHLLTVPLS